MIEHVGARQLVGEEVARRGSCRRSPRPGRGDVLVEERLELAAGRSRRRSMCSCASATWTGTAPSAQPMSITRLVAVPRETRRRSPSPAPALIPVIALSEPAQPLGVGVDRLEEVAAGLRLVLRLAGPQALGERSPEPVQAGVHHLEEAAQVARLGPVEEESRSRACCE